MASSPFYSSPNSHYEDQENILSSPFRGKPRRPPTVTPKRFTKFFTPRGARQQSKAGRQLQDITRNGGNRRCRDQQMARSPKRRKVGQESEFNIRSSPPLRSSPLTRIDVYEDEPQLSPGTDLYDALRILAPPPEPTRRLRQGPESLNILQRSFGGFNATNRGRRSPTHCTPWQSQTANFHTNPADLHVFNASALPFCTASCNTNSLVAIGDESGCIRVLDSSPAFAFGTSHVEFRPHHNAIMDLAFSSDDYKLATASGDQTSRIVDMHTQTTVRILSGHTSSVKQIHFSPTDPGCNVLTTSSRDGSVQWGPRFHLLASNRVRQKCRCGLWNARASGTVQQAQSQPLLGASSVETGAS